MARYLRKLADFLLALALVAFADVVLFHFGAYFPLLQPQSHSGLVEWRNRRMEAMIDASPRVRRVVVMGNSMAEASVRESQLEAELATTGRRFQVISYPIGGSSPRSWYVLLRNSRVGGDNTEVVVLAMHNGALRLKQSIRNRDLEIVKTRLTVTDAMTLAAGERGPRDRLRVAAVVVFRTLLFRDDLRQYLDNPARRHRQLARIRAVYQRRLRARERIDNSSHRDLLSARLGPDDRLVLDELDTFLKSNPRLRRRVERALVSRKKIGEAMARDRQKLWAIEPDPDQLRLLRLLIDELNREGVKVVVSIVPKSPYSLNRPYKVDYLADLVGDLKQHGADVEIWQDREMLRTLHSPAYYRDELHLNAEGAEIYTRKLGRFLASITVADQN